MPTRTRLKIVALAFAPFFLAALALYLLSQANIIEKDPTPFDGREAYTPFWLPFKNPVTSLKTKNPEFQIFDSVGLLLALFIRAKKRGQMQNSACANSG